MLIKRFSIGAGVTALLLLTVAARANTVYTMDFNNEDAGPLGTGPSADSSNGVFFTAPSGDHELLSWSFATDGLDPRGVTGKLDFIVAPWNGTTALAPLITVGASPSATPDPINEFNLTFTNLDLNLTPGNAYIAYVTVNGVNADPTNGLEIGSSDFDNELVVLSSCGADQSNFSTDWRTCGDAPAFQATFGPAGTGTPVPEPVTLSLFGVGLAGAAALRRRKKKMV